MTTTCYGRKYTPYSLFHLKLHSTLYCLLFVCGVHQPCDDWVSVAWPTLLIQSEREGCSCPCVNSALRQPCVPRHDKALLTPVYSFHAAWRHCTRSLWCVTAMTCIFKRLPALCVHRQRFTHVRRQGCDARRWHKLNWPFFFCHQGNKRALRPAGKGCVIVGQCICGFYPDIFNREEDTWNQCLLYYSVLAGLDQLKL